MLQACTPIMSGMVGEVWIDPVLVVATAALLLLVVLLAAWVPARRAARVEPTVALRA